MSYDIIYDKMFVKVNDKTFIPMILAGSSNCTEWSPSGKERRARSWSNFSFLLSGGLAGSMEQMLEKHSLSDGGGGCNMTYGRYLGITKTGCKKALTIEQLAEENVYLSIKTYRDNKTDDKLKSLGLEPLSFTPRTTQELEDFLEGTAPKYMPLTHLHASFSGMFENSPKWIRRKYFPKVKTEKKQILSLYGYTIKASSEEEGFIGYLYSFRGGSFRYVQSKTSGKQFIDKKEAERIAKKMTSRRSGYTFKVELVTYICERSFYVPVSKNITLPEPEPEVKMSDEELIGSLEVRAEGEEIANLFDPEKKCFLDPVGVALHDFIKGCEVTQKFEKMQQALGIFREKYPEEYYVLLD
jgi:hypothetical protein